MQALKIEDDDGFTTTWPWPEDRLILANPDFIGICEMLHNSKREQWLAEQEKTP